MQESKQASTPPSKNVWTETGLNSSTPSRNTPARKQTLTEQACTQERLQAMNPACKRACTLSHKQSCRKHESTKERLYASTLLYKKSLIESSPAHWQS
jgi:hypothetical protein